MPRHNNFDFLRLLFASLVIFSHSYPLTGIKEILPSLGFNQTLGEIAVHAFFILSGFLIFNSMKTSDSIKNYFWKRCIRLFPGLLVMLILTIILLPILDSSVLDLKSYYSYLPSV